MRKFGMHPLLKYSSLLLSQVKLRQVRNDVILFHIGRPVREKQKSHCKSMTFLFSRIFSRTAFTVKRIPCLALQRATYPYKYIHFHGFF